MAVNLSPVGGVAAQFFSNNGVPLTGGKLYTYLAGTTTPAATYTTTSGGTAWTNPIVLDAAGRVSGSGEIWVTNGVTYKFVIKDSNDVLIGTYDNVVGMNDVDASQVTYTPAGSGAVETTVQAKLRQYVSPEDFGADPTGVVDSTSAINAALAASDIVVGTGSYLASNSITVSGSNKQLKLRKLMISAPVVFTDGGNCIFAVEYFGVTNSFPIGGNMLENGTSGDSDLSYNFNAVINYATGTSPDAIVRAHVVRNYRCSFSRWNIDRTYNTKNVYTCDQPAVNLNDNRICGNIIENADYGVYVYGTGSNHVEHHILDYNFVAGAKYGAYYTRERGHYQYMTGGFDFNGQGLVQLDLAGTPLDSIGDVVTGSVSGATGEIIAINGDSLLLIKLTGTFLDTDVINTVAVDTVTDYKAGGPYLDFISQTAAGFARHTINASYLTNVFGNNQEDWVVFKAFSASNTRASIAGQSFVASSGEQYTSLSIDDWSVRGPGNIKVVESTATTAALRTMNTGVVEVVAAGTGTWTTADGSGNKLIEWNTTDGLELGQWSGSQIIKANRNLQYVGGTWETPHPVLGTYHIWVDSSGKLRIKNGQPSSDTDGTVVGTQT